VRSSSPWVAAVIGVGETKDKKRRALREVPAFS
jgi:hypothetical protein